MNQIADLRYDWEHGLISTDEYIAVQIGPPWPRQLRCSACDAGRSRFTITWEHAWAPEPDRPCPDCKGRGYHWRVVGRTRFLRWKKWEKRTCGICNGTKTKPYAGFPEHLIVTCPCNCWWVEHTARHRELPPSYNPWTF